MIAFQQTRNAMNFTGRVVLVTGSSSGIGAETVRLFSYLGAQVIVTGRNISRIKQVGYECYKLSPYGLKPLEVAADLTVYAELYDLFEQTIGAFNCLDVLVNNAGIVRRANLTDRNFSSAYQDMIAIDETAVLQLTQLFIPYLNQTNGTIINIASDSIDHPVSASGPYAMTKSAIAYETQALAIELGPRIRVNSVRPGIILHTIFDIANITQTYPQYLENRAQVIAVKRNGEPIDIARGIIFIASPLAQFFDGQGLTLDGGFFPTPQS